MAAGVVVVGMDRSGTSAATRLISLHGLRTPPDTDVVPAREANPRGVWESASLVAFNIRVLATVNSDDRFPAALEPGWERDSRLDSMRHDAWEAFDEVFPAAPWVWKDPLLCLTFGFWRNALDVQPVVVLVNRNPLEIAASALLAWGRPKIYGLALWERYIRQALAQITDLPVLVTNYEDLVSAPLDWCQRMQDFLRATSVPMDAPRESDVLASVDPELRHAAFTRADVLADVDVSEAQRALFLALEQQAGAHERFAELMLPEETPTTEALLDERRRAFQIKRDLERLLELERQSRWWPRIRRARWLAPLRPVYIHGRRLLERVPARGASPARQQR